MCGDSGGADFGGGNTGTGAGQDGMGGVTGDMFGNMGPSAVGGGKGKTTYGYDPTVALDAQVAQSLGLDAPGVTSPSFDSGPPSMSSVGPTVANAMNIPAWGKGYSLDPEGNFPTRSNIFGQQLDPDNPGYFGKGLVTQNNLETVGRGLGYTFLGPAAVPIDAAYQVGKAYMDDQNISAKDIGNIAMNMAPTVAGMTLGPVAGAFTNIATQAVRGDERGAVGTMANMALNAAVPQATSLAGNVGRGFGIGLATNTISKGVTENTGLESRANNAVSPSVSSGVVPSQPIVAQNDIIGRAKGINGSNTSRVPFGTPATAWNNYTGRV